MIKTQPAKKATDGKCHDPEYQAFMEKACPFACDVCSGRKKRRSRAIAELKVDAIGFEENKRACEDMSPKCEANATDGLCKEAETRNLMMKTCPSACGGCKRSIEERQAMHVREIKFLMEERKRTVKDLETEAGQIDEEKRGCKDFSSKCEQYAVDGFCKDSETSGMMSKTCPVVCGICKRGLETRAFEERGCKDRKAKCETWATDGMCKSDPDMAHFMAKTCPFACDTC